MWINRVWVSLQDFSAYPESTFVHGPCSHNANHSLFMKILLLVFVAHQDERYELLLFFIPFSSSLCDKSFFREPVFSLSLLWVTFTSHSKIKCSPGIHPDNQWWEVKLKMLNRNTSGMKDIILRKLCTRLFYRIFLSKFYISYNLVCK